MPFLEEVIHSDFSYGSTFDAAYAVDVTDTAVNHYVAAIHPFKVARFSIQFGNKTLAEQIIRTLDLFDRCGGTAGGCLITHKADFSTNGYIGIPTAHDQPCIEINSIEKTYQIVNWYGIPSATCRRRVVKKPKSGTVLVSIRVGAVYTPTLLFTVDYTTGIITLNNPLSPGQTLYAGCYFNIPVMFETDLSGVDWRTRLASGDYILGSAIQLMEVLNPEDIE